MKIFCEIKDGAVVNRAVFGEAGIPDGWDGQWVANEEADIGWTYANGQFIAPPLLPAVVEIPTVISSRQFFLQLAVSGLTDQVTAWVSAQDPLVQIAFNKSATFLRADEMLQQGFSGLGFTVEQLDGFFTAAAGL
ncbi:hypothetical protein [Phyllobacterium sp. P5_D12]